MPEGYTHVRTAKKAALLAKIRIENENSFALGANGPDILFSYKVWMKADKRGVDLPKIGGRLHDENTWLFLKSLIVNAKTRNEREYVLGFLSHYAADCTIHPFIVMLTEEGQSYHTKGGHGYSEIAIDSFLHKMDTGNPCVGVNSTTPYIEGVNLRENASLLKRGIKDALDIDVSLSDLCTAFKHSRFVRSFFVSPLKISYSIFYAIEPVFGGRGFITGHVTPASLKQIPAVWKNPFTGETVRKGLLTLLKDAEMLSAEYMRGALSYWKGKKTIEDLEKLMGSKSYLKGIPDEKSIKI